MSDAPHAAPASPATSRAGGTPRRKTRFLPLVAALAAVLAAVTGCAGTPPLSFPRHSGYLGSFGEVLPGQVVFVQVIVPAATAPVTLISARPLPLPGLPAPSLRITRIGVWSLPGGAAGFGRGYPPHGDCAGTPREIPCRPGWKLAGFRIRAGDANKLIYFWITAPRRAGNYYLAGLAVTYRSGGQRYTASLYTLAEYCVADTWHRHLTPRELNNALNATGNQCGHGGTNAMDKLTGNP